MSSTSANHVIGSNLEKEVESNPKVENEDAGEVSHGRDGDRNSEDREGTGDNSASPTTGDGHDSGGNENSNSDGNDRVPKPGTGGTPDGDAGQNQPVGKKQHNESNSEEGKKKHRKRIHKFSGGWCKIFLLLFRSM